MYHQVVAADVVVSHGLGAPTPSRVRPLGARLDPTLDFDAIDMGVGETRARWTEFGRC